MSISRKVSDFGFLLFATGCAACYLLYKRELRRVVPKEVEDITNDYLTAMDDLVAMEEDNDAGLEEGYLPMLFAEPEEAQIQQQLHTLGRKNFRYRPRMRTKMVMRAANHAVQKHGLVQDSDANRLMLSDTIRKYMREAGMRPSHIRATYGLSVELALTPTKDEVFSAAVRKSRAVRLRKSAMVIWKENPIQRFLDLLGVSTSSNHTQ